MSESRPFSSMRLRWAGLVPLAFVTLHFYQQLNYGNPWNLLWWCHAANIVLAAGLLFAAAGLVRISVIWLSLGLPLWVYESIELGELNPTSCLTHLGGLALGLFLLSRLRAAPRAGLHAFLLGIAVQLLSGWLTPAELNVNVSHGIRPGWEGVFSAYWQYRVITTIFFLVTLLGINRVLMRIFPAQINERKNHEIAGD